MTKKKYFRIKVLSIGVILISIFIIILLAVGKLNLTGQITDSP